MSETSDGRLLTGAYGTYKGRRHQLVKATPSQSEYFLDAQKEVSRGPAAVNESDLSNVFSVRVVSSWRECEVLVHEDLGGGRWEVEFIDGPRAWATGARLLPGIDGDPRNRVSGWMHSGDLTEFRSLLQRYAGCAFAGEQEARWEYGPLA